MDNVDKYSVAQYSVKSLLGYIDAGDIAIPEIQRPFVWNATQVRDLIDSLLIRDKGYRLWAVKSRTTHNTGFCLKE